MSNKGGGGPWVCERGETGGYYRVDGEEENVVRPHEVDIDDRRVEERYVKNVKT